jgi:hypothetical protein
MNKAKLVETAPPNGQIWHGAIVHDMDGGPSDVKPLS